MKIKVDFERLPDIVNKVYEPLLNERKARYIVLMGGAGSGKSWFCAQTFAYRAVKERPIKIAVVRKVGRTLEESVVELMRNTNGYMGLDQIAAYTKNPHKIDFKYLYSKVVFTGLDDPEKLKSIEGFHQAWVEEATELKEKDFEQLDLRLRGKPNNQIWLSFNPITHNHWLKKTFFDTKPIPMGEIVRVDLPAGEACVLRTNYTHNKKFDNPDDPYVRKLNAMTGVGRDVYLNAEWGVLEGLVYKNFISTDYEPLEIDKIYYGLDFGFSVPTALVQVKQVGDSIYVKQMIYQTHLTNNDLIERMKKLGIHGRIYCDSAEPARIAEIKRAGFDAVASEKGIMDGVDYLLSQNVYVSKNSIDLLNEVGSYVWNERKDLPVDDNNHALDAIRYAVYTHSRRTPFYAF